MSHNKRKALSFLLVFSLLFGIVGIANLDTTYAATKKIHLRKTTITVTAGKTFQQKLIAKNGKTIKATIVKWKSSKPSIAKIDKKGKIKAVKNGTVKMTAKYKGKTYKFTVKVKKKTSPAPTHNNSISINPSQLTIMVGEIKNVIIHTDKGLSLKYGYDNDNATCSWGDWINSTDCELTIIGSKLGTTTITVYDERNSSIKGTLYVTVVSNPVAYLNAISTSLIKSNCKDNNNRYYDIVKEKVDDYQTFYDKIYVTNDKQILGFADAYYYSPQINCYATTTEVKFDLTKEAPQKEITIRCEIIDEPYGDSSSLPSYTYVLETTIDGTQYTRGDKLEWRMVQNDNSNPRDISELASSFADFAALQCIDRFNNFLQNKYQIRLPYIGIKYY